MCIRLLAPGLILSMAAIAAAAAPKTDRKPPAPALAAVPKVALPATLPEHPRLLLTKDALAGIHQRAEKTDGGRETLKRIRRTADSWLKKDIVLPDRGGQWPHWYACKKDGGRLKTESPTRHVCTVCGAVYTGYPYDDVVVGREHSRLAEAVLNCGLMFQLSGDRRYAAKAAEILVAYAGKYTSYPLHDKNGQPKVGGGRMSSQTLDESMWLIPMAQGADLVWETLSPSQRTQLAEGLFRPAAEVIRGHRIGVHNIQCWKNSAVGLVGLLLDDRGLIDDAINNPDRGYAVQMARGVQPDGCWYEGSWGYHFFTLSALWPLTEAARNCGMTLYGPELRRMFAAPLELTMPNLTLPALNDSGEVNLRGNSVYEVALARYGDPQFARPLAAGRRDSLLALVLGQEPLPTAAGAVRGSENFPDSGYAVLCHGDGEQAAWLLLKYGPHCGGHGHPDKLGVVFYARGEVVALDPGTALYGVPIQKQWYRTTLAHNTLVVDERSQAESQGRSLAFVAGPRISAALADAGPIYPGIAFQRAVALFGDDLLLVVDRCQSAATHTYDLVYHNRGTLVTPPTGAAWTAPDGPGYMHFQHPVAAARGGTFDALFKVSSKLSSRFAVALPDGWQAIVGTGVAKNSTDRVPMVVVRGKGQSWTVGWAVSLGERDAPALQLKMRNDIPDALQVTCGDRAALLVSNPQQKAVDVAGKSYRAPIVCIERIGAKTTVAEGVASAGDKKQE